jgi:hypothetical protein
MLRLVLTNIEVNVSQYQRSLLGNSRFYRTEQLVSDKDTSPLRPFFNNYGLIIFTEFPFKGILFEFLIYSPFFQ